MPWPGKKITGGSKKIHSENPDHSFSLYWNVYRIGKRYAYISIDTSGGPILTNKDKIYAMLYELKKYAIENSKGKNDLLWRSSLNQYANIYTLRGDYQYWLGKILHALGDPMDWNNRSVERFPSWKDIESERQWIKSELKRTGTKSWHRFKVAQHRMEHKNEYFPIKNKTDFGQLLYFIACGKLGMVKIGVSSDPKKRLSGIQTAFPFPLEIVKTISQTHHTESHLHQKFSKYRKTGEWFHYSEEIKNFISSL